MLKSITIAPSIGPMLSGCLSYAAGWTWIFWFLCIAAGLCLSIMILFLPETSRSIVGNGSIRPPRYLRLPITISMCHWKESDTVPDHKWRMPNPLKSLKIITRRDNAVIILACGILYIIYTCINTSLSVLFIDIYKLNQWQAGLIYLPFGLGGTVSTFFSGPLLNKAYRDTRTKQGLPTNMAAGDDLDNFSVEKARLRVVWIPMLVTTCSVVAFGWVLQYHQVRNSSYIFANSHVDTLQHISIPLFLQFVAGLCMQLDFSVSLFFPQHTPSWDLKQRTPRSITPSSWTRIIEHQQLLRLPVTLSAVH